MPDPAARLLGDIGGTNARFALQTGDTPPQSIQTLAVADHVSLADAARGYLATTTPETLPREAAIAVAAPVAGERVELTNSRWSFSLADLQRNLGLDRLHVVNDFVAVALSVMKLGPDDVRQIGGGTAQPATPIAVLGPGTGLGVSGLVPAGAGWVPLATEGGHATLPAVTPRETEVIAWLRARHGHVSAERVLSGPGLVNLHTALSHLDSAEPAAMSPDEITRRALANTDPVCREALSMFCALLGTVAGDQALTLGALGGVFIAGGIVPKILDFIASSDFRERFEDKGRFRPYMATIPTFVITRDMPALLGLVALLDADDEAAHSP